MKYQLSLSADNLGIGVEGNEEVVNRQHAVDFIDEINLGNDCMNDNEINGVKIKSEFAMNNNHNLNNTLLLESYHIYVQNLQNQSLIPHFHPQTQTLEMLLGVNYPRIALVQHQSLAQLHTSTQRRLPLQTQLESSPPLDYHVPPDDTFHQSLRIWFINQRSNYHRRQSSSSLPSTMTDQRQKALEEINFPWSGRFRNRWEEMQYDKIQEQKRERQREKERRKEQKEREEREKVERLTSIVAAVSTSSRGPEKVVEEDLDIMDLWDAEDDEDDW